MRIVPAEAVSAGGSASYAQAIAEAGVLPKRCPFTVERSLRGRQCGPSSHRTRRWRRESRANPSLKREILAARHRSPLDTQRAHFFQITPLKGSE
jgi:hypothetical protein